LPLKVSIIKNRESLVIDKPLFFALCLGLAGGATWILIHFLKTGEFTWLGVVFFVVATLSAYITGSLFGRAKKN